jgi:hypothetical protein
MALYPTGVTAFDTSARQAEQIRQGAELAAQGLSTFAAQQTALNAAARVYFQAVIAAGLAQNPPVSTVNAQTGLAALKSQP